MAKLSVAQIAAAAERYRAGEPAQALAAELGCGERTLRRHFARLGVKAAARRPQPPRRDDSAPAAAPAGWTELVDAITSPPDDPVQWATWVRQSLTQVAMFRLRYPELNPVYSAALDEFRATLRDALAARNEDLVADTIRMIKADLAELEDSGPETVHRPRTREGARPRRRRRKGETPREFAERLRVDEPDGSTEE